MPITFEVVSYRGQSLREPLAATFDQQGGTLGRSQENDLILADPLQLISRKHAIISYENNGYYLQDTSQTGTFIDNKDLRVHGTKVPLDHGDRLRIGDYELVIAITGKASVSVAPFSMPDEDPFPLAPVALSEFIDIPRLADEPGAITLESDVEGCPPSVNHVPSQEPAFVLSRGLRDPEASLEPPSDFDLVSLLDHPQTAKMKQKEPNVLPDIAMQLSGIGSPPEAASHSPIDFDPTTLLTGPEQTEIVPPSLLHTQKYDDKLNDVGSIFLEAAGLQDASLVPQEALPELMRTAGTLLREAITALWTLLRGRAASKSILDTTVTTIQAVQNNPLKFASVDEALTLLLTNHHPGYLTGVEAVRAGCMDIIHHDLARTASVQTVVLALLARFAPQHIVEQSQTQGRMQWSPTKRKAKCWEAHCQAYHQVMAEAENFFGLEAFGRAYEEHIEKLHS
jgi:type VI secretion system FHA domain protein